MATVEALQRHAEARAARNAELVDLIALVKIVRDSLAHAQRLESDGWRLREAQKKLSEALHWIAQAIATPDAR